jgi:hypothetical protein
VSSQSELGEAEVRITSLAYDAELVFSSPVYMMIGDSRVCGICQFKGHRGSLRVSTEVDESATTFFAGLQALFRELAGDNKGSRTEKAWSSSEGEMSLNARSHEDRVFLVAEVRPDLNSWDTVARIEVEVNRGAFVEISVRVEEFFTPPPR